MICIEARHCVTFPLRERVGTCVSMMFLSAYSLQNLVTFYIIILPS